MRILILGAGAIGGYFGARLIEAGVDVSFLVREARAARLRRDGLRVHSARGEFAGSVQACTVADGTFDLVVVSCKAWDLDSAIAAIAPAVGPQTLVLPLLNGLRHLDALDAAFGRRRVFGGVCHISVTMEADGSIRQFGSLERLTFGSRDGEQVPAAVADALRSIGPQVAEADDVLAAMWNKFAFIATLAGITCLLRGAVGEIMATPEGDALIRGLYREACDAAAAAGHVVPDAERDQAIAILCAAGSPLKASMLRDVERGARTECEHVLGDLRERAQTCGLYTPLLSAALASLRIYEAGRA